MATLPKFFSRRRNIVAVIALIIVIIALALILLATGAFSSARSLLTTPKTTAITTFDSVNAVPGWVRSTDKSGAASNSISYALYQKPKSSCTYTTGTYLDGILYQHRSDFWISKDVLYGSASQNGTLVNSETAVQLAVKQGGSLQFASASWNVKDVNRKSIGAVSMAARAIDTSYKIPQSVRELSNPSDNGFGLDSSKAIPVLIAAYQCSNPKDASPAEFQRLLQATTVNLK